jgi:hypothetical protein
MVLEPGSTQSLTFPINTWVQVIRLDPSVNKSSHIWHLFVRGLEAGAHYAYPVDGAWALC